MHIARVKPPWRDGGDRTRCGRRVADEGASHWRAETAHSSSVTEPDEAMAARAAADWRNASWKAATGRMEVVRATAPDGSVRPAGKTWGAYGLKTWRSGPLEVLRADLAVTDDLGRVALARELIALADLVAAHPAKFRELIEREAVLPALGAL